MSYVEQRFGAWTVPGGMAGLGEALRARLETRRVTVLTGNTARDLVVREGRVVAVATDAGELAADVVVCAVDPRRLPALAPYVERTMPAIPPVVTHLGLEGDVPDLGPEVVLHGDPMLVVRTGGRAPDGCAAWTVHGRGRLAEDILRALARHRIDVRANVVVRQTAARGSWWSSGAARRWACCGRAGPRYDGGSARPRRSRASTPPGRTPPPAAGCRSSGSRRPWSPRPSARPDCPSESPWRVGAFVTDYRSQTVIRSAAKISRVALDRLSV